MASKIKSKGGKGGAEAQHKVGLMPSDLIGASRRRRPLLERVTLTLLASCVQDAVPPAIKELYGRFARSEPKNRDDSAMEQLFAIMKEQPSAAACLAVAKMECLLAADILIGKKRSAKVAEDSSVAAECHLVAAAKVATEGALQHNSATCLVRYALLVIL